MKRFAGVASLDSHVEAQHSTRKEPSEWSLRSLTAWTATTNGNARSAWEHCGGGDEKCMQEQESVRSHGQQLEVDRPTTLHQEVVSRPDENVSDATLEDRLCSPLRHCLQGQPWAHRPTCYVLNCEALSV
jgi:hypothetical protein